MGEPAATAIVLLTIGVLLLLSALSTRLGGRIGIPIPLLFLGLGILAGSEGVLGIAFTDHRLAFRLGTAALALILFDGGLNTSLPLVRRWYKSAAVLATVGVLLTAVFVGVAGRLLGFSWPESALLGAVVSSTDAAAVFSALRSSGMQLKKRVGLTLELESGINDPTAVILTMAVTNALTTEGGLSWSLLLHVPIQIVVGGALGVGIGVVGQALVRRARLSVSGLYPVLTVGVALMAFAVPTLMQGSGFLAVYLVAMILGDGKLPYRSGLVRFHDALAWFGQVGMFLILGLLVFPSQLLEVAVPGVAIALILAALARPLAVATCLLPFRFPWKETLFVSWVGLRGAVPIILATFPVIAGVPGANKMFNLVFFIVLVNAVLPGMTVGWSTRRLGLQSKAPEAPVASLEISSTQELAGDIMSFHIDEAAAVAGQAMFEVPFPPAAAAMLIIRGRELIAPRGGTKFLPGDHVYVFCRAEDRPLLQLLFGHHDFD